WPPPATTDAFLNRSQRTALGLSLPERRIAQTSHDFIQAMGPAPNVVLTRAQKRDGSPMVPSRFLLRMRAVAGAEAFQKCQDRGDAWKKKAQQLDAPLTQQPWSRPAPTPPTSLRPMQLSVTRIERLRRDPYALYAE